MRGRLSSIHRCFMRLPYVLIFLTLMLCFLQYKLWFGQGGIFQVWQLQARVKRQLARNTVLHQKNLALEGRINRLKHNPKVLEAYARYHMGVIRRGETFYRLVR